jgi:hypothetical protein
VRTRDPKAFSGGVGTGFALESAALNSAMNAATAVHARGIGGGAGAAPGGRGWVRVGAAPLDFYLRFILDHS